MVYIIKNYRENKLKEEEEKEEEERLNEVLKEETETNKYLQNMNYINKQNTQNKSDNVNRNISNFSEGVTPYKSTGNTSNTPVRKPTTKTELRSILKRTRIYPIKEKKPSSSVKVEDITPVKSTVGSNRKIVRSPVIETSSPSSNDSVSVPRKVSVTEHPTNIKKYNTDDTGIAGNDGDKETNDKIIESSDVHKNKINNIQDDKSDNPGSSDIDDDSDKDSNNSDKPKNEIENETDEDKKLVNSFYDKIDNSLIEE